MTGPAIILLLLGMAVVAWISARARANALQAQALASGTKRRPHSLPSYHGWYVALWALVPALVFLAAWSNIMPGLVTQSVLSSPAASSLPEDAFTRSAVLGEARNVASGAQTAVFNPAAQAMVEPYRQATRTYGAAGTILALILSFAGGAFAFTRVRPDFRARTRVERLVMASLLIASLLAIVTTVGIVASLLWQSIRFFSMVNPIDFLFGLKWSPQSAALGYGNENAFGAIPLFWGTIFIGAIIAMAVAIPLGLMTAVYLTQYARPAVRKWMKPILEVLAGDRKSTRLNSSHTDISRMPSSA